jgi:hypothetical protein
LEIEILSAPANWIDFLPPPPVHPPPIPEMSSDYGSDPFPSVIQNCKKSSLSSRSGSGMSSRQQQQKYVEIYARNEIISLFPFFSLTHSHSMNISQASEYNYNLATNSSNGMPYTNRPLPFLCHESTMNQQQAFNHMNSCCPPQQQQPQQPLMSNEHIYNEYEPYQQRKFNSRYDFYLFS